MAQQQGQAHPENRWWTLGVVCVATFMLLLDITVVNVALPDIARSLGSTFTDLQWVVDAYVFSLASLLCALATSPLFLDLARAAQGVGGAAMFATSLALIAQSFHGRDRG